MQVPELKVGSYWEGHSRERFIITAIDERNGQIWVQYDKYGAERMYECLARAFIDKFRPVVN